MFTNLEELKNEILQGKTNEQIIEERLAYLNSLEYKSKRLQIVKKGPSDEILFFDGFISPEEEIGFDGSWDSATYSMDDITIYGELIDIVRDNMHLNGFPIKDLVQKVQEYFEANKEAKYYELAEYLNSLDRADKCFARTILPDIIDQYNKYNGNFDGSLKEFAIGYILQCVKGATPISNEELLYQERYLKSVGDNEFYGARKVPISAIKGTGVAKCTEHTMLTQNFLAFLGYEAYMFGGELTTKDKREGHNFNVVKNSQGKYIILDVLNNVIVEIKNASSIDDVRMKQSVEFFGITYNFGTEKSINIERPLQQKEAELSLLEEEEKIISEAETLIEQQKEGQDIGEE